MAIKIYSTPSCSYCTAAKRYFREKGISFSDYDVSRDPAKADEMVRKSGQSGVPVIDINGKIIIGFNRPAIDSALK